MLRQLGLEFLFYVSPGFHGFAVPPRSIIYRPYRGSEFRSLALANCSLNSDLSGCFHKAIFYRMPSKD